MIYKLDTKSLDNLTGWHGQAMLVRVFTILVNALYLHGHPGIVYPNVKTNTS